MNKKNLIIWSIIFDIFIIIFIVLYFYKDEVKQIKIENNFFSWVINSTFLWEKIENIEEKFPISKNDNIVIKNSSGEIIKKENIPSIDNIKLNNYNFNSNINNLIEITGSGKNLVKYVNIGWVSLTPINESDKTFLTIAKNTFNSWDYFIILQLENNEIVTLNEKIIFTYSNSKVNIANITPDRIKNDKDTFIVLQWNGFAKIISMQLSNNIILKTTSFDIINDNVMSVKIPKDLEIWNYYFNIMTVDGITEVKNNTFYITN